MSTVRINFKKESEEIKNNKIIRKSERNIEFLTEIQII